MKPATVAIAFLEYEDVPNKGKRRPVLILKEDEEMISVFKISTKYGNKPSYFRSKYFKIQAVENKDYQVLKKIALVQEGYDPEKDYNRYFEITGTSKDDLHYLIDDPDVLKFKVDDMYVYSI